MNELQRRFFEHMADMQEVCVQCCMIEHKCFDKKVEEMLYDVTYEMATSIMEMIDGYTDYSNDRHDIVNTVTGEHLRTNPDIELHDQTDGILRY